jgi:predicted secreted hydrolase
LTPDDFRLQPVDYWNSPHTEAEYPISWRIEVPDLQMDLQVEATFPDQEMVTRQTTGIAYWEGSISVAGRSGNQQTSGVGYLEMTGYSGRSLGELFRTHTE